jgi:histone acetyltransferase (RNA polymerase elongator complex component)
MFSGHRQILIETRMHPRKMIYPVFLPHAGCPFQCIYCNQEAVVSQDRRKSDILQTVEAALRAHCDRIVRSGLAGEIAFFGGTFSALPPELIDFILSAVSSYVERGIFTGIRFSTRPDCMEDEVIDLLSKYPVRTVELGVQSLCDPVLQSSRRGYGVKSVYDSAKRVRDAGWELGIQLMAGLPGDTLGTFTESMQKVIEIAPDFLRIYPTLVLEGTALADSYRQGSYTPLSLDEAVTWVSAAYASALSAGIAVIRMGLHPDPSLEMAGVVLAGPFHPAFGHLVRSRWWRDRLDRELASFEEIAGAELIVRVAPERVSEATGHRKSNLHHWKSFWGAGVKVTGDTSLAGDEMLVANKA